MGMQYEAVRQGKWVNQPKTGYDLVDGELVPNEMAPVVRRIITLRAEGQSQGKIADATGVKYSTVLSILGSRIYLGEVQMNGEWFPGKHEAIVTREVLATAHRGRIKEPTLFVAPTSSQSGSTLRALPTTDGHRQ